MKNQVKFLFLIVIYFSLFSCSKEEFSGDPGKDIKSSVQLKTTIPIVNESEPNNTEATADVMNYGPFKYIGTLLNDDQEPKYDYIKLVMADTSSILFQPCKTGMLAEMYDIYGTKVATLSSDNNFVCFQNSGLQTDWYYLRVSGQNLGDYTITVVRCESSSVINESEPNNNLSTADQLGFFQVIIMDQIIHRQIMLYSK